MEEECRGWSCQERGNMECLIGGKWMRRESAWHWLKLLRRMQKIGTNGEGKCEVATP